MVGGNLRASRWDDFDDFVKKRSDEHGLAAFPPSDTVFDYHLDVTMTDNAAQTEGKFVRWDTMVKPFAYDPSVPFVQMLVPTVDTARFSHILELSLDVSRPALFVGATGVGKTAIVSDTLDRLRATSDVVPVFVNFSAQTTAISTQELIEGRLEKKRKTRFGAPAGKRMCVFVDDVNMPQREVYGEIGRAHV